MCKPLSYWYSCVICLGCFVIVSTVHDWELIVERIESNTTNSNVIDFDLRPIRHSPGIYAINGTVTVFEEIDDSYFAKLNIYRSSSGSSQYKSTPYQVPKSTFYKFMTSVYVKMLQKDLESCSNFPQYQKTFDAPIKKGAYYFNMCIINNDGMPTHLQPGYYKAVAQMTGKDNFELWVALTIKVISKSL